MRISDLPGFHASQKRQNTPRFWIAEYQLERKCLETYGRKWEVRYEKPAPDEDNYETGLRRAQIRRHLRARDEKLSLIFEADGALISLAERNWQPYLDTEELVLKAACDGFPSDSIWRMTYRPPVRNEMPWERAKRHNEMCIRILRLQAMIYHMAVWDYLDYGNLAAQLEMNENLSGLQVVRCMEEQAASLLEAPGDTRCLPRASPLVSQHAWNKHALFMLFAKECSERASVWESRDKMEGRNRIYYL